MNKMKNDNTQWMHSGAKWITLEGCDDKTNLYVRFIRTFELDAARELTLDITAVSQYQVWINGQYLCRGPAVGDLRYYYYDTVRIGADLLRHGVNTLAVLLYHDGDAIHPWQDNGVVQSFEYGKPGLLVCLRGEGVSVVSDKRWKTSLCPEYSGISRISRWGGYCESYHGDKEQPWMTGAGDGLGWHDAVERVEAISEGYVRNLVKLELPPLEVKRLLPQHIVDASRCLGHISVDAAMLPCDYDGQAVTFSPGQYGAMPSITLDFGTMTVGYPGIELEGAFGICELWYGETLDMHRLDVVRKPAGGVWKAFQRRAFRYLKVNVIAMEGDITLKRVIIDNTWYAFSPAGCAESSDAMINRIMDVSKHTLRMNTSYHFEDCPWREQALWIFDMRVMAIIDYYYYGDIALPAKNLRQCFAIQNDDGSVNSTGPKKNAMYHPDFCMHLTSTLAEYYRYSGDASLVNELMPYVCKLDAFIHRFADTDGLLDSTLVSDRGTPFLDWSGEVEKIGKSIIFNAVFAAYLEDMAFLCRLSGADDSRYVKSVQVVNNAVAGLLYDADRRLYCDTYADGKRSGHVSFQGNMAALYGGFVPKEQADALLDRLSDTSEFKPPFAPSFYLMVFETLARFGRHQDILGHIKRYWGGMLSRQAVTWWEVFDPDSPQWAYPHPYLGNVPTYEMNWIPTSSCHGWSGAAGYAIPRYLLGIDLFALYQNKITIKPGLAGYFEAFTYKLPLRGGLLWMEFKGDGKKYQIEVKQCPKGIDIIY